MRKSGKCPKCGSSEVLQKVRVVTNEGGPPDRDVQVRVDANPSAMVFKQAVRSPLDADICTHCGYTESFARDPESLRRAFLESQQPPKK